MFRYAGRTNPRVLQQQRQRRRGCLAAIASTVGSSDTKRRVRTVHNATVLLARSGSFLPPNLPMPAAVRAHHAASFGVSAHSALTTRPQQLRHLSTRRGLPPVRSIPEKIFAGAVVAVLAAWGLIFGAITVILLPFVGLGLFLLRRNFQRGGVSRNLAAGLARKMAERAGGAGGGGGGVSGGGGGGVPWMHQSPTEGALSSLLAIMLGGMSGTELVSVLRSEVEKRVLRHPGLSSSLGGGIEAFSDTAMSTVGSVGGTGAGAGGQYGQVPSRVTKARLRFSGKRGGAGGAGWAEVEVTGWDGGLGEEEGMEFDRIFVTLDNGRTFDLTGESFADDGAFEEGGSAQFLRRGQHNSSSGSKRASRAAKGTKNSKRTAGVGSPVEAEFRDKK